MVLRGEQQVNFNVGGDVAVQQSNTGNAALDPNQFRTSTIAQQAPGAEEGTMNRILERLVGAGDKLGGQMVQQSQHEAYLSGMAQAGTISNEAELQANPITKDWATAGYRDTMGKIVAADTEAQIAADMPKLREMDPAKFAEYLAEKRKVMVDSWTGMSATAREAMFSQQALNERAWLKKQQVEHYKFVVDTKQQALTAVMNTHNMQLDAAKSDVNTYAAVTDATYGALFSNVVMDDTLPAKIKGKMISDYATWALEHDHQDIYKMIQSRTMPMLDGTEAPMSSLMSWDDSVALSKAYRESQKRTETFRNGDYHNRKAAMEADWANPDTPLMPESEVEKLADEGKQRAAMSGDEYESFKKAYYNASVKKVVQTDLANMYQNGDIAGITRHGKSSDEALDAYVTMVGRKLPMPELVDKLLDIGKRTGQVNAFRKVGQVMGPAFQQLGNNEKVDPNNAVATTGVLQKLDKAESEGQTGAFQQFLSAFEPEVQAKISYIRENMRKTGDAGVAISRATQQVLEESKMPPAMRAAVAASKASAIDKAMNELEPTRAFGPSRAWLTVQSMFGSADAQNELALSPERAWFGDKVRADEVLAETKVQYGLKMHDIARNNPSLDIESVKSMALANLAGRTVPTKWGNAILPDGMTPQSFFGVGKDVSAATVGKALDEYLKPAKEGGRMVFRTGVQGELTAVELDSKNNVVQTMTVDKRMVPGLVEQQDKRNAEEFKANYGKGVSTSVNGTQLQYNGDNTVGVDNAWMRRFRDDLLSTGTIKASNLPPAVLQAAFMKDSDNSARFASQAMQATGAKSEAAFKLFAYVATTEDLKDKQYSRLVLAVKNRNVEQAKQALERTPLYRNVEQARKQYLMNNLLATFKE